MTATTLSKTGFPAFRKSAFAALLLSATMLAGCATNRTPQFSYDADVPPLPTVQAAATDTTPRPLHVPPAWIVARGGEAAGTATARVENANAAARVEPRREGYYNAIQIYPWSEGALYQVYAAVGQITTIALEPGESLTGAGPIAAGDTARWVIGDHIYQVLTKRARHMREQMVGSDFLEITPMSTRVADALLAMWPDIERLGIPRYAAFKTEASIASLAALIRKEDPSVWPLKNVWFGVSAEDQQRANDRVRYLLETPAAIRFVSAEPLLGPINFEHLERTRRQGYGAGYLDALRGWTRGSGHGYREFDAPAKLDWIIVGGESGPDARPMHREWARSIRNQCLETGVAFHFKQWGEWMPADDWYGDHSVSLPLRTFDGERWRETSVLDTDYSVRVGRRFSGRHLDNEIHNAFPIDIQIAA